MMTMKLVLLMLLVFPLSAAYWDYDCSNTKENYTSDSGYRANLEKLLSQVSSNTEIDYGFFNFSAGRGKEQANVMALCRGDVTFSDCHRCLNISIQQIKEMCPDQKEAILWRDTCMLRYTNRYTTGSMLEDPGHFDCDPVNASDAGLLWKTANDLLTDLQSRAAKGDSRLKFATGEANVSRSTKAYGLVQCTPDLSEIDCFDCIRSAMGYMQRNCYGSQGARDVEPSCNVVFGINPFYGLVNSPAIPPPQAALSASRSRKESGSWKAIIGVVSAAAFVQLVVFVVWLLSRPKRRVRQFEEGEGGCRSSIESLHFDFGVIRLATDNFSDANKLGRGAFGAVYKGTLPDGQEIAVKRLAIKNSRQGELEFKNEVLLVAKLQHRNLVRLHGFSFEDEERLLVYEFVPNASLDHFLFEQTGQIQLDWDKRSKIIGGIAKGLLYLHEDSRLRIIHRDLKASNILVDAEMNPKIGDFGVARHFQVDHTHDTNRIVGTFGYMAPEYGLRGSFSTKSDVYSFGVLVLEILTGNKCLTFSHGETSEHLISLVWRDWIQGKPLDDVDPIVLAAGSESDITRCMHIGLLCVQDDASNRPTMSEVNIMLRSHFFVLPTPSEPTFVMGGNMKLPLNSAEGSSLLIKCTSRSVEDSDTFTDVYPR